MTMVRRKNPLGTQGLSGPDPPHAGGGEASLLLYVARDVPPKGAGRFTCGGKALFTSAGGPEGMVGMEGIECSDGI
jgi:hypothetical protein